MNLLRHKRALGAAVVVIAIAGAAVAMNARTGSVPSVTTADVTRGDFVDYIQIRGEIRPAKSIVLAAPLQAGGELQIVKLVKNGSAVKKGDLLVEFDATQLQQRLLERKSELKTAEGEIQQVTSQQAINAEQQQTDVMKAKYDVERAKLDLGKRDLISRIEYESAKLSLADAEQRLKEVEAKALSAKAGAEAELTGKRRKRDKAQFDVERTQASIDALHLLAPADGTINILENPRSGGPFGGGGVEFREGDRAWAGASILELPDLSSIHLEARLDESDRGRLKVGQVATVKIEAVPGKDFTAKVDLISVLARVDFSSGWPPVRNFDLGLILDEKDTRIRPGMTATARIAADRLPNVTLVPAEAIFQKDGHPIVYRLSGSKFDEQQIEIVRRGREQAAVSAGVNPGDKLAARRPEPEFYPEEGMKRVGRRVIWIGAVVVVAAVAVSLAMGAPVLPTTRSAVPTAKVVRGPLKLTVYATGELRAGRTVNLMAPPAGGTLRIVKLIQTGIAVKKDDVVLEFDAADQEYQLEQAKSDLAEADQQIVKMKADQAVQASQEKLDMLTARYNVRRGELDAAGNEFIGTIEAQKNVLTLEESRRRLKQLEEDASARKSTADAALAVVAERRNKAQLAMQRAQGIIDNLAVKAPTEGVVSVKENRDGQFFFFSGMVLPQYREGDTTFAGRNIADIVEAGKMEVRAKVTETDRDNLQQGQQASVVVDALPGRTFNAKVGALGTGASRGNFFETSAVRQFDIALQLDQLDPQMRAGSSVRVVIDGRDVKDAVHVPRQAIFEKAGKNYVFVQIGDRFDRRDVKVTNVTESRAIVTGLNEGDVIALVDPDVASRRSKSSGGPLSGASGPAK